MKKIEWDLNNGIIEVEEFSEGTHIMSYFDIEDLKINFRGTRGAEVSDEVFLEIKEKYGIQ